MAKIKKIKSKEEIENRENCRLEKIEKDKELKKYRLKKR